MAAAGIDHWIAPPTCIADILAACCAGRVSCECIRAATGAAGYPPLSSPLVMTIQNVSGCPCISGTTATLDQFSSPPDTFGTSANVDFSCDGITYRITPGQAQVQCLAGPPDVVNAGFVAVAQDLSGRRIEVDTIDAGLNPVLVSFHCAPLEIIWEVDIFDEGASNSGCFPGRLRLIITT